MSVPTSIDSVWLDLVDRVARRLLGRADRTGSALAAAVRHVSDVYTRRSGDDDVHGRASLAAPGDVLAARLRFFLPRDLPKIAPPIRELAWADALPAHRPIRVLDVGSGLGTTSFGTLDALRSLGLAHEDVLDVTALDDDPQALSVFAALADELLRAPWASSWPQMRLRTVRGDLGDIARTAAGPFDLIVAGFVLNELTACADGSERPRVLAATLRALGSRLAPDGALVVLEPALAVTSRALSEARDALLASPEDLCVFAPCTHAGPCPMLERPRDWCHEDVQVALPPPLASVARAAGLRFEGLTFSYLTIRRDGRTLGAAMSSRDPRRACSRLSLRVVGGARPTKGKTTITTCGEGGRYELVELQRDVGRNGVLGRFSRGDLVLVDAPEDRGPVRVRPGDAHLRASPSDGPLLRR